MGKWTENELNALLGAYENAEDKKINLDDIAEEIGRSRSAVACKAYSMGLTNKSRMKTDNGPTDRRRFKGDNKAALASISQHARKRFKEGNHPRGMLGKKHSNETKEKLSELSSIAQAKVSESERTSRLEKASLSRKKIGFSPPKTKRGSWVAGWRQVGGREIYFRSRWEANYAFYLQWLLENGAIRAWEYEPKTFWFENIRRGVRSYKPDFFVTENNGDQAYHEIKGWMDSRSRTTLKRMAKYYPDVQVILIREREYKAIRRKVMGVVPGWEDSARDAR